MDFCKNCNESLNTKLTASKAGTVGDLFISFAFIQNAFPTSTFRNVLSNGDIAEISFQDDGIVYAYYKKSTNEWLIKQLYWTA